MHHQTRFAGLKRVLASACGWLPVLLVVVPLNAATRVPLTVVEREGTARVAEPVTFGVPIPKGQLSGTENVRLTLGGREVPAQFRAAGLWRPGSSVRWLLVDLQATLKAKQPQEYVLEYGDGVERTARPPAEVQIEEDATAFTVRTGPATFRISKRSFSLFDEIRLGEAAIVPRPAAGKPRAGARLSKLQATVTRAIPAAANQGRSHLIHVEPGGKVRLERYTLRFTDDRQFEVVGVGCGPIGKGTYGKDFASSDGAITIPGTAWLAYAHPKQGDVYTFRTIPAGRSVTADGIFEATVVERGPLRSVIRLKGSFGPATAPVMEYTAWYHFFAGSSRVKLAFTLENNDHGGRTPDGNARNAEIGGTNCVFFDEMSLELPLALGGGAKARLSGSEVMAPLVTPLDERLELYQDSSGGKHWDRYAAEECRPRPNNYVSFPGYQVTKGDARLRRGDRSEGWIEVSSTTGGATVAVTDFWQNYPKALSAGPGGRLRIALFPGNYAGDYAFRSGEHKTHEMWLEFYAGGTERAPAAVAAAANHPLRLEATPAWYARTQALGSLHPLDTRHYAAYEVRNLSTIGIFPEGKEKGTSLLSRREEHEFYGWMDYGDVPIDFESPSGQWGMKYDLDYQMAQQFTRTLRPEWWNLFAAACRHTRDIDVHHQPHYPGLHFVKGGVWAHSLHGEPGHKNPNRNYNHFTKDLAYGARGTATYYYLTGDWKSHDACLEIAENALAQYMSPQQPPDPNKSNRMGWRGDACTLNRLLEGYLLSGDNKFLEHARWQIASCAYDGRPTKHKAISLWSSVFYMMALTRYVQMFPDDAAARGYLKAHVETLRKAADPEAGIYYTITPQPDGSVVGQGTCTHYNIMAADALAIGYLLTGDASYLETARRCFDYGVKNACWENGPPTYTQVHSANGATHGNVFMVVDTYTRLKAARDR